MIALFIVTFAIMCVAAFAAGCYIGEVVIRREEREKHESSGNDNI